MSNPSAPSFRIPQHSNIASARSRAKPAGRDCRSYSRGASNFRKLRADCLQVDPCIDGRHNVCGMDMNDRARLHRSRCRFPRIHSSPDGFCPSLSYVGTQPTGQRIGDDLQPDGMFGRNDRLTPTGGSDVQILALSFPHTDITVSRRNPTSLITTPHAITDGRQHDSSI